MSNNEWQENENEINVCLGKLPLFIHVSSQFCVWLVYVWCVRLGVIMEKITRPHTNKHNQGASDLD